VNMIFPSERLRISRGFDRYRRSVLDPHSNRTRKCQYDLNLTIGPSEMKYMKEGSIVLHPLPRIDEIAKEVDDDKGGVFPAGENGMLIRMALLKKLCA